MIERTYDMAGPHGAEMKNRRLCGKDILRDYRIELLGIKLTN